MKVTQTTELPTLSSRDEDSWSGVNAPQVCFALSPQVDWREKEPESKREKASKEKGDERNHLAQELMYINTLILYPRAMSRSRRERERRATEARKIRRI